MARGRRRREGSLHKGIRISGRLLNIILDNQRYGERYQDTLVRMLDEQAQRIKELEARLQQYRQSKL
jgi:hypothetical protein